MPSPWHQHPTAYPDLFRHKREEQVVASRLYDTRFESQLDNEVSTVMYRDMPGNPVILDDRSFDDERFDGIHYHAKVLPREAFDHPKWRVITTSRGEWGNWSVTLCPFKQNWWEYITIEEIAGERKAFDRYLFDTHVLAEVYPIPIWEGELPDLDDAAFDKVRDLPDDAVRYPKLFSSFKDERINVNRLRLRAQEYWFMMYDVPSETLIDDVWLVSVGYFHELWRLGVRTDYCAYLFDSQGGKWGQWSCLLRRHDSIGWFDWIHGDTDAMRAFFDHHRCSLCWSSGAT